MANEDKKDFNAMLNDSKDIPKFQTVTDEKSIEKYGGDSRILPGHVCCRLGGSSYFFLIPLLACLYLDYIQGDLLF